MNNFVMYDAFTRTTFIVNEEEITKTFKENNEKLLNDWATLEKCLNNKKDSILSLRRKRYSNVEISQMLKIPYSEVKEL